MPCLAGNGLGMPFHIILCRILSGVLVATFLIAPAWAQSTAESVREAAESAEVDVPKAPPVEPDPVVEPAVDPLVQDLTKRLAEVEKELQGLKRSQAESKAIKSGDDKATKSVDDKKAADEWLDLSGDKWTVRFGGHMQADFIHWANADDPPVPARDYFEFRRLRLLADGTGYGVFDFRLQMDIEPESGEGVTSPVVDIKDAYLTMNEIPWVQRFRIGNFFVPYSLEQVTNDTNNTFMERSVPTQGIFAADREVGVAFYGINDQQNVTWAFGTFLDSISESTKERIDDNQGQRISGRLTWLPYYDEPSNGRYLFHLGTGVLYTRDQDGVMRFRTRPQIHEGPFLLDSGNVAASSSTSANVEMAMVWGSASLQSELFLTNVNRTGDSPVNLYGAYLHGSYFLTGENRIYERYGQHGAQFARNVPYTNFFLVPGCVGLGAWEAKARLSLLDLSQLERGQYHDLTVGMNWYWTDRIRVMFDWIHPITNEQAQPYGETTSDVVAMRFDFNF